MVRKSIFYVKNIKYIRSNLHRLFSVKHMYGKPFGIKTLRNKGFSTTHNIVNFKVLFTE